MGVSSDSHDYHQLCLVIQVVPLGTATAHGAQAQMDCNSALVG